MRTDTSSASHFGHPDIDVCLDILGACILSDRLERDEELIELANSAQVIAREVAPELVISRRDITHWFNANRDRLDQIARDADAERALMQCVTEPVLQRTLLACIYAVAVCDYHVADEESAFIRLALEVWAPETLTAEQLAVLE